MSLNEREKKRGGNTDGIASTLVVPVEDAMSLEVLPSPPFVICIAEGRDARAREKVAATKLRTRV
ncbi:hypothetical protein BKA82DRAFT_1004637 [Pisolithus tinctorius]|uniref:Uncharacterized protein n=1 Tax=Pisolithus tinctorius Marx 270 TaxID=870435 RepID=A0A0C3JPX3_PISTI|nr:hypothetical protein BKA82DRAFT_1004637 [Pisolithus tinctorius]KIN99546.1 hypothetical protein M404DRAFT_1004637 [Pisolithus tinctorius Marx 270]